MRYSNALEIIAMTLMWAAALIWYDIAFNQHFFRTTFRDVQIRSTAQVSMWLQHVGCNGKTEAVLQALGTIPWLGKPELKGAIPTGAAATSASPAQGPGVRCDIGVLANVTQVAQADFMAIYTTLRRLDVVPTTVEFGGIPHFSLQAHVPNLRCEGCDQATLDALKRSTASAMSPHKDAKLGETFKWLDSKRVDPQTQSVTAFVRFNNLAHVHEMVWSLTQAGLPPASLQVALEEVRQDLQRR